MSNQYFTVLTEYGERLIAQSTALEIPAKIKFMAIGDGNGHPVIPDRKMTSLVNEIRRSPLNSISIDEENGNQIIFEQGIPDNEGGFYIREIGLYDDNNQLVAVANCPETYKPRLSEGSGRTQLIRMIVLVSSANSVELKTDPSTVWVTRLLLDKKIEEFKNELASSKGFELIGSVSSVDELRNTSGDYNGQRILLKSYYNKGSSGGGIFIADLEDIESVDNKGTCIVANNGVTKWKRIKEEGVFDFGAVGDGVENDTLSFDFLEKYSNLIYIDLKNRVFKVDKIPRNKIYFNGSFLIGNNLLKLDKLNLLNSDIVVTVGENGDFENINSAINYLVENFQRKKHKLGDKTNSSSYSPDSLSATIKLLSGFIMKEQIIIRQSKLGWINLIAEDDEVIIDRSYLNKIAYFEGTKSEMYPAFYAGDNSEQLLIACKFKMNNNGESNNRHGYVCNRNSSGHIWSNCGINNAGGHGAFAREASKISCRITYFLNSGMSGYVCAGASVMNAQGGRCSGSYDGVSAFGCSIINFERGVADNCVNDSLVSLSSSNIGCDYASLNNAGRYGVRSQDGGSVGGSFVSIKNANFCAVFSLSSHISFSNANFNGSKIGASADKGGDINLSNSHIDCIERGIHAKNGSRITATDSSIKGIHFSVNANFGSQITITNSDCKNGDVELENDIQVSNGSFICAINSKGGTNVVPNFFSEKGVIFK